MDVPSLEARSGWQIQHHRETTSTNDEAAAALEAGAGPRTAIVADRQRAGRGRKGRHFASPPGGLYVSLLLAVPPEDLPGGCVALVALATAEAIEALTGRPAGIKWPNDLWMERRKVGGILLERRGVSGPVIAGIGLNLDAVPADLPADLRPTLGALAGGSDAPVDRDGALLALLAAIDRCQARRAAPGGAAAIEQAWRARLVLLGEPVRCTVGGEAIEGTLEDVSLGEGLLIRDALSGPVWRAAEHVQDLRPCDRTI